MSAVQIRPPLPISKDEQPFHGPVAVAISRRESIVATASAQTVSKEPAMGMLKPGERVLVDDRSCPAGQIKEVIGGDHTKAGGKQQIERRRRCIPKT